ncbi:MAG: hypothetical protein ACXV75_09285 [Candidatus Angelobacter sp.]
MSELHMGFSAMVRWTVRVAAFLAMAALLLQASCTVGPPAFATVQIESPGDSGCHESAPSTPHAPNSDHICCGGDHSPDALLSAVVTPAPPVMAEDFSIPISVLIPQATSPTDVSTPFLHPPGPLALRI